MAQPSFREDLLHLDQKVGSLVFFHGDVRVSGNPEGNAFKNLIPDEELIHILSDRIFQKQITVPRFGRQRDEPGERQPQWNDGKSRLLIGVIRIMLQANAEVEHLVHQ